MLYATTRSKVATYTAQRALKEERAPDGGYYVPTSLPVYTTDQLEALYKEPPAEIVARILNGFFNTKLGRYDVEFAVGKRLFGLAHISHRILIGELWRCGDSGFDDLCRRLTNRISAEMGSCQPGVWMRIACRIALVFAMYAELRRQGITTQGELMDAAVMTADFEGPYALWTAKRMGLPVGQIICCCNENNAPWVVLHQDELRTDVPPRRTITASCDQTAPSGLERLLYAVLGQYEAVRYGEAVEKGERYRLEVSQRTQMRKEMAVVVVSQRRLRFLLPNIYRDTIWTPDPYTAMSYAGLADHRARTGDTGMGLIISQEDPVVHAAVLKQELGISESELRNRLGRL